MFLNSTNALLTHFMLDMWLTACLLEQGDNGVIIIKKIFFLEGSCHTGYVSVALRL